MNEMTALLERLRPAIERLEGRRHDGEELYGEVALACVQKSQRYDWSHPQIERRVMRMARNLRIGRLRRERLRRHGPLPADDCRALAYEDFPSEETRGLDSIACQEAIARLPAPYRRVILEHFTRRKRFVAIASEMTLPAATVRTHCRRALQQLARDPKIRELAANKETGHA